MNCGGRTHGPWWADPWTLLDRPTDCSGWTHQPWWTYHLPRDSPIDCAGWSYLPKWTLAPPTMVAGPTSLGGHWMDPPMAAAQRENGGWSHHLLWPMEAGFTNHYHLDAWAQWEPGHLGAWVPGRLGTWAPGNLGTWAPGNLGAWKPRHLVALHLALTPPTTVASPTHCRDLSQPAGHITLWCSHLCFAYILCF